MNIRQLARKVWIKQILILLSVVSVCAWDSWLYAKSVLIGGAIFLLPTIYFALLAFRVEGDSQNSNLLNIYRGEVGKFVLTTAGFAVAFTILQPVDGRAVFLSYLIMTIIYLVLVGNKDLS